MFVTTRQLNAALSGLRLASEGDSKDKEFYDHFKEALEAGIEKCLKRKVTGLEISDLDTAEFVIKIAAIHDGELKKDRRRR